jgi:glutamate dehydrogenase/leucine dehydrogenase
MSGFKNFAVSGIGNVGQYFVDELLNYKEAGKLGEVSVLTREVRVAFHLKRSETEY